ncbi:3-hydroxyacyl-CoA dehydrogenase NAD-binding domain-containing protein, partial [Frankia sp. EI5c]|uniref:3-hydroxyacyl-CoA dehydrogenase NAD-binding domain-containing protein n=1 Tax=Frankia sp. EI5c TaxID=683316 RepID=UPI001F5BC0D2
MGQDTSLGELTKIGVVGLGTMGAGIAEVLARAGIDVIGVEKDEEGLARGRGHLEHSTQRAVDRGKLTDQERAELLGRVSSGT